MEGYPKRVAFHKHLTISWVNLGPFLLTELYTRFVGLLARTCLFSSANRCSIGLRSGLCDGHANTLTLLSLSHFATTLKVCLGSLSIWKPHLRPCFNFLTDVFRCCFNIHIIFLPHDAIYFVKCTSPFCSKAPLQHDAATPVLHGWDGVLRLASLHLFPPNITRVIMAKQFYFCFIKPEDISPKSTIFVPMCNCNP